MVEGTEYLKAHAHAMDILKHALGLSGLSLAFLDEQFKVMLLASLVCFCYALEASGIHPDQEAPLLLVGRMLRLLLHRPLQLLRAQTGLH